jgi:hypothetical protein
MRRRQPGYRTTADPKSPADLCPLEAFANVRAQEKSSKQWRLARRRKWKQLREHNDVIVSDDDSRG